MFMLNTIRWKMKKLYSTQCGVAYVSTAWTKFPWSLPIRPTYLWWSGHNIAMQQLCQLDLCKFLIVLLNGTTCFTAGEVEFMVTHSGSFIPGKHKSDKINCTV